MLVSPDSHSCLQKVLIRGGTPRVFVAQRLEETHDHPLSKYFLEKGLKELVVESPEHSNIVSCTTLSITRTSDLKISAIEYSTGKRLMEGKGLFS